MNRSKETRRHIRKVLELVDHTKKRVIDEIRKRKFKKYYNNKHF